MAAMNEKDYVNTDLPTDATVQPAASLQGQDEYRRESSPPTSLKGKAAGNADTESLNSDITLAAQEEGIDPAFYAKVQVLNRALSEIGMGRYQWELFFSGGFGWFADNICEYLVGVESVCCAPLDPLGGSCSLRRVRDLQTATGHSQSA